jgi:ligand-binding sensor domain-containing protein/signal transduction histidine kinase
LTRTRIQTPMSMTNIQRIILLLWLGCLTQANVRGQTLSAHKALGRYQQLVWQDQHGLPQNGVLAILQTRDGYLWLGTIEGAARFDGVRFVVFDNNNTPEFKSNQILSLAEDRRGSLWLGAVSGGLTRYTDGRFRLYTTRDGLSSDFVRCLLADRAGNLWIGTRGGGLNLFRDERFKAYTTRDGLPSDQILALAEDLNGGLWIGTSKGLARFEQGRFTAYTTRDGLPHDRVNALWPEDSSDNTGSLLVGTGGGLCRFRQGRCVVYGAPVQALTHNSVTALYEDRQRNLWIGTGGNGLFLLRDGRFTQYTMRDGLPSDTVLAFYEDPEGDIWAGTVDGGLVQLRQGRFSAYTIEDGLPHNFATAVFEDSQGSLWIGTNGGIGRLKDGKITAWTDSQGRRPENDSITEDRAGNLWFSARGQLTQFRNGQFRRWTTAQGLPYEPVRELLGDRAGNLWISAPGHGLTLLREGRFRSFDTRDGLADNEVMALYEGRSGQLWVGTRHGSVSHFEEETQRFITWTVKDGLPGDHVQAFYEDRAGSLWIGTNGGGLHRFKNGKFTAITVRDGLFDNRTFQILSDTEDDSGDLWLSSNRGIFRVSLRELNDFAEGRLKSVTSFVYGVADGMISRECNGASPAGWKTRDGRLWFPTVKGVVAIDPRQRNTQPSLVAIERITLDRAPLPAGQPVRIKPDQENLEIEYTGINWRRPQQIRFKYQLAGFNQDWVDAGTRRTAYFSNLPPGNYTFKVIADNGEGVWNTEGTSLRVVVLPPFYRAWWFLALAALAGIGAVFAAFKYRFIQLERRQAAQQAFARELLASQEAERQRIAAELHDSLGQNLLVIKNRALLNAMTLPDERARAQFTEFSDAISQTLEEVRSISYDLRPSHLDQLGLRTALVVMIEKVAASSQLQFTHEIDELEGVFTPGDEIVLYRIVQECLNNILKHSGATQAEINLAVNGNQFALTVRDNGRGFAPDGNGRAGLGLQGIAERARILGGAHTIQTAPGQGTTVTVRVELKDK